MTFTITAWTPDGKQTVTLTGPVESDALVDEDTPRPSMVATESHKIYRGPFVSNWLGT